MTRRAWPRIRVADLVASGDAEVKTGPFGTQLHASDYVESGTPVINVRNIGFGGIRADKLEYIADETVHRLSGHVLHPGDIVFGRKGAVERHVLIRDRQNRWFQGSDCLRLRLRTKRVLPKFLSYYLLTRDHQTWMMQQCSHGATMASLNQDIVGRIEFSAPDLASQEAIAAILSAYDDLIENNMRRISILEEMARRIYEEWFVRFRFPGHEGVRMVESELGLVPEGWSVQGLYDVADLTYGFPFKSSLFKEGGEGLGVIRIRDIRDDHTATRTTEDVDPKYRVVDGDILVGMDGAFHMGRWAGGVAWLNQRVVRFRPKSRIPRSWLFWATEEPIKTLEATIVGTTVAHLSARDLKEMRLLIPSKAVLEAAGCVLEPMSDLELTLKRKNAVLRVTRDLLLPKLISGGLDMPVVPDPEAVAA